MPLVNAKKITKKAFENGWAVPHININNLEWVKTILITAQENKSPVILGTSLGAVKYMGGYKTICGMVSGLVEYLKISVPVALHLDHAPFEEAMKALDSGYTSVMYDGSHKPLVENLEKSKLVIKKAKAKNASVEVEIGLIGSEEYGIQGEPNLASVDQVAQISKLGPDMIAVAIGNIHGQYPKDWKSLNFQRLEEIKLVVNQCLVLHGGSGIPTSQVKRAIKSGVGKVNVNTELQLANAKAIREFVRSGKSDKGKNYDPRKLLAPGCEAMKVVIKQKMKEFGSINKA